MIDRGLTFTKTVTMVTELCYKCGVCFAMPSDLNDDLRENGNTFWCVNGHPQIYTGKTSAQKLKEAQAQLEEKRRQLANEQQKSILLEDKNRKLDAKLKRVHKGVCPCCNRSFENLRRHMETKHPEELDNFIKLINSKTPQEGIVVLNKLTQAERRKLKK